MWIPISTVTALCIFLDIADASIDDESLETLFNQRSQADWAKVWHQETHSRCREKLIRHLYWACEKDIYRLSRRNGGGISETSGRTAMVHHKRNDLDFPWISKIEAHKFLRYRRDKPGSGSITSECCTRAGCTWEEYAEYCPSNKRINHY